MSIQVKIGDVVTQHKDDVAYYTVPDASLSVSRIRPAGNGVDLHTVCTAGLLTVSGGIPGARYELTIGDLTFQIRITTDGFKSDVGPDPFERGKVVIKHTNGTYDRAWVTQ